MGTKYQCREMILLEHLDHGLWADAIQLLEVVLRTIFFFSDSSLWLPFFTTFF